MPGPVRAAVAALVQLLVAFLLSTATAGAADPPRAPVGGDLLGTQGTVRASATPRLPAVTASGFVVADLDSGAVLAARAPHRRLHPASTLKLLTALVLLPRLEPSRWHVATRADADAEGSRVGLVAGQRYSVPELWHGLLLASGNDAAHALAAAAGGVAPTVDLMNAEARRLGALDTRVVNASGLDADGQTSSAYDLALVARAVVADEDFRRYAGAATFDFPGKPRWRTYQIQNQNRLLGAGGVFAGKTGYTTLARQTFVATAERDGRRLVVTVLRPAEGVRAWREAADLLDWGFRAAASAASEPVGRLVEPGELDLLASSGGSTRAAADGGSVPLTGRAEAAPTPALDDPATGPIGWSLRVVAALTAVVVVLRARVLVLRRRRASERARRLAGRAARSPVGSAPGR